MKKSILFFVVVFFTLPKLLTAQFQSGIQLDYGYTGGYFKDYNYSPLHYSERGHNIGLAYLRRKEDSKNMFRVKLNPKLHSLNHSEYNFLKSTLLGGDLSISYERQLIGHDSKFELFAGLGYGLDINFIDFLGLESYSWLFRHGLNVKASTSYRLNDKHQLRGELQLPLFHILNRPPYNGVDKYVVDQFENNLAAYTLSGDLQSWNKYGSAAISLDYLYSINIRWQLIAGYRFDFRKVFDNTKYTQVSNQFLLGLNFNI